MQKTTINIIIPCYNPPLASWAQHIVEEFQQLEKLLTEFQLGLIVINDGSSKGINESDFVFLRKKIKDIKIITYVKNQGKGYALRQGAIVSVADYHVFTDIDFPYELFSVAEVAKQVSEKGGIAAGYRNQNYYQKVPLFRKALSIAFRSFIRLIGVPVSDTQCGLKGFDNAAKEIFIKTETNRYLFDFEFLILAARQKNIAIYSVPVQLKDGVTFTTMGLSVLRTEFLNLIKILLKGK